MKQALAGRLRARPNLAHRVSALPAIRKTEYKPVEYELDEILDRNKERRQLLGLICFNDAPETSPLLAGATRCGRNRPSWLDRSSMYRTIYTDCGSYSGIPTRPQDLSTCSDWNSSWLGTNFIHTSSYMQLHTVTPSGPAFMRPEAHKMDHIPFWYDLKVMRGRIWG